MRASKVGRVASSVDGDRTPISTVHLNSTPPRTRPSPIISTSFQLDSTASHTRVPYTLQPSTMLAAIPPSSPSSMPAPSTAAAAPAAIPGGGAAGDYIPRRPSPLSSPPRPPMNLHHTSPLQFSFLPMSPPTSPPSRLDFGTPSSQQTHWRDRHRPQGMMRTPLASRRSQLNVGPSSATTTTKLPSSSLSSTDASREKRRDIFLKRVRREREDSRWHARGGEEEVCLLY